MHKAKQKCSSTKNIKCTLILQDNVLSKQVYGLQVENNTNCEKERKAKISSFNKSHSNRSLEDMIYVKCKLKSLSYRPLKLPSLYSFYLMSLLKMCQKGPL